MPESVGETFSWQGQERRKPAGQLERATASRRALAGELSGLTVERCTQIGDLERLRGAYEALNRECSLALPFTLYEWQRAWCDHFLAADAALEDSLLIYVIRTPSGQCVGIVPLVRTHRRAGPFRVSSLSILGADRGLTEIRMPLIAPGFHLEVARIVRRELGQAGRWDWIQWMGATAAFGRGLAGLGELRGETPLLDYLLDLPDDWESLRKSLKRNIRESLRHCYNSLKRDHLQCALVSLAQPEQVQAGLTEFFRLHAMRAGMQGTVAHADYFASPATQAFLRDVCARLAARNVTRVFQLTVDGKVVATRIGFVMGDTLYLYFSGFDTAWAKYSVMTTALAEIIKYAIAHGVRTINLSPGTDVGKTRWGSRAVPIGHFLQVSCGLRARCARFAYEYSIRSRARSRWIALMVGAAQRRY